MSSFLIPVSTPVVTILLPAVVTMTMSWTIPLHVASKLSLIRIVLDYSVYACSVGESAYEWADKERGVSSYYLWPARAVG